MFWRVNQTKLGREEGESPKGKQTRRDGMLGIHVPTGNQTRANECRNRQRERERGIGHEEPSNNNNKEGRRFFSFWDTGTPDF